MNHIAGATPASEQLSMLEQAAILSGENTWQTRSIPRTGVRPLFLSDGPHGIRKQAGAGDHLGINASIPATCFPTAATIANSWDPELGEQIGQALGREAAHIGVDVVLGPGLNIKRSPLGGRSFEYFSEDPYLSGKIAAAYVRGIQSQGVAACPKHFAVNSQETRRMASDSVLDQATLREIYLTAFEIVVREGKPRTIMSSYNRINGTYAHENSQLLQDILRDEWGFEGTVITDWGGANDPVAAITAGGTLQMPSPGYDSVRQILAAKDIDLQKLATRAQEVVDLIGWINPADVGSEVFTEHNELARTAAEQSIVLLKNDNELLPLVAGTRVAVIGDFAQNPRYQGAGSSLVNPTQLVTPLAALEDSGLQVVGFAQGFDDVLTADPKLVTAAVELAGKAQVALLYLGLDALSESEGKDRDHLQIPQPQIQLLKAVSAANPNTVVVFTGGSAVEMPWLGYAKALLHGYLGGQAGAPAMVRALTGEVNPAGRLAETFPLTLGDTPTAGNFPEQGRYALYREGPYVGYRFYQSAGRPVLFPFGFGLSYTKFEYSDLEVRESGVSFSVVNTGSRTGSDVPQLYVSAPAEAAKAGPRPVVELKGFKKVTLRSGEKTRVEILFDDYTFRIFDPSADRWTKVGGNWRVQIGRNAADMVLSDSLTVVGGNIPQAAPAAAVDNYRLGRVEQVTNAEFAKLLNRPVPEDGPSNMALTVNSPLRDLEYAKSWVGRAIYKQYFVRQLRKVERTGVPDLNLLFQYGMPFRSIANMSGGLADTHLVDGVLTLVNGQFFRGLQQIVKAFFKNKRTQKQLRTEFEALASGEQSPAKRK